MIKLLLDRGKRFNPPGGLWAFLWEGGRFTSCDQGNSRTKPLKVTFTDDPLETITPTAAVPTPTLLPEIDLLTGYCTGGHSAQRPAWSPVTLHIFTPEWSCSSKQFVVGFLCLFSFTHTHTLVFGMGSLVLSLVLFESPFCCLLVKTWLPLGHFLCQMTSCSTLRLWVLCGRTVLASGQPRQWLCCHTNSLVKC